MKTMSKAKEKTQSPAADTELAQDKPAKQTVTHKVTEDDTPVKNPHGHYEIKGHEVHGKNETRLFGTGVNEKSWLTKEEAQERGFYWKN